MELNKIKREKVSWQTANQTQSLSNICNAFLFVLVRQGCGTRGILFVDSFFSAWFYPKVRERLLIMEDIDFKNGFPVRKIIFWVWLIHFFFMDLEKESWLLQYWTTNFFFFCCFLSGSKIFHNWWKKSSFFLYFAKINILLI